MELEPFGQVLGLVAVHQAGGEVDLRFRVAARIGDLARSGPQLVLPRAEGDHALHVDHVAHRDPGGGELRLHAGGECEALSVQLQGGSLEGRRIAQQAAQPRILGQPHHRQPVRRRGEVEQRADHQAPARQPLPATCGGDRLGEAREPRVGIATSRERLQRFRQALLVLRGPARQWSELCRRDDHVDAAHHAPLQRLHRLRQRPSLAGRIDQVTAGARDAQPVLALLQVERRLGEHPPRPFGERAPAIRPGGRRAHASTAA